MSASGDSQGSAGAPAQLGGGGGGNDVLFPGLSTLPSPEVRVILEVRVYSVEPATTETAPSLLVLLAVLGVLTVLQCLL